MRIGLEKFFRVICLSVLTLVASGRAFSYTIDLSAAESTAFRFVPVDDNTYAITCLGARIAFYERRGGRLVGETRDGGAGRFTRNGARIRIRDFMGGPATLTFAEGILTNIGRNDSEERMGKDAEVARLPGTYAKRGLTSQWNDAPEDKTAQHRAYWVAKGGGRRWHLWFANPNAAGALFAELALLSLAGAVVCRGRGKRVIAGACLIAAMVGLAKTGSRGCALAFLAGCLCLTAFFAVRKVDRRKALWMIGGLVVLVTLGAFGLFGTRWGARFIALDWGNTERLAIWREVPRMLAAAPGGWGVDGSGRAYCDWYQFPTAHHPLIWLVNTHFTWWVEHGRWFGIVYVFGWLAAFVVSACAVMRGHRLGMIALAQLVLWFTALWFSTLGQEPILWIMPATVAVAAFVRSFPRGGRRLWLAIGSCLILAPISVFSTETVGRQMKPRKGSMPVRVVHSCGVTTVGRGRAEVAVVTDDDVSGRYGAVGRAMRRYFRREHVRGAVCVVRSLDAVPSGMKRLVLFGRAGKAYLERYKTDVNCPIPESIVFLSPPFVPDEVPEDLRQRSNTRAVYGAFSTRLDARMGTLPDWVETVPAAELHLPGWPRYLGFENKAKPAKNMPAGKTEGT